VRVDSVAPGIGANRLRDKLKEFLDPQVDLRLECESTVGCSVDALNEEYPSLAHLPNIGGGLALVGGDARGVIFEGADAFRLHGKEGGQGGVDGTAVPKS